MNPLCLSCIVYCLFFKYRFSAFHSDSPSSCFSLSPVSLPLTLTLCASPTVSVCFIGVYILYLIWRILILLLSLSLSTCLTPNGCCLSAVGKGGGALEVPNDLVSRTGEVTGKGLDKWLPGAPRPMRGDGASTPGLFHHRPGCLLCVASRFAGRQEVKR